MKRFAKILSVIFAIAMIICSFPAEIVSSASGYNWVGAWGSPAVENGIVLGENNGIHLQDYIPAGSTIRSIIVPTISGTKIRLKFSNYYGEKPITINEATVAQTGETDDIVVSDTITQITFNGGETSVTIAPGSEIYSDAINFSVKALKKISVSSYYKKTTTMYTTGLYNAVTYLASSLGNRTHKETMTTVATRFSFTSGAITYTPIPFLTRLDVYAEDAYSVVIIGDSTVTNDISVMLAEKLQHNNIKNVGIVMSGIIGNELLNNGTGLIGKAYGDPLLERAQRDAFDIPGVKYVIIKIGLNDVLHPMLESNKGKLPLMTSSQVIDGYCKLSEQALGSGIKLYLCTRTPYKGYERNFMGSKDLIWMQKGETTLKEINNWIKSDAKANDYAGYIDLDALRSPEDPAKLRDHMTPDGAHLTNYGQIAFVDLIPEAAYGVKKELKDYADIVKIDPYVAPSAVTTTKQELTTTNNTTTQINTSTTTVTTTAPAPETTTVTITTEAVTNQTTQMTPGIIVSPAVTTTANANANQVIVETPLGENDQVVSGNVSDAESYTLRQTIGFVVLAIVAMAIISIAAVMLVRIKPKSSAKAKDGDKV